MPKTLSQIKKEMLAYVDFFGGDISATDKIKGARNKKQLAEILDRHDAFLEDQLCDAKSHLSNFRKSVGLSLY